MKRNDCDIFPDTVIISSSALYPLAKVDTMLLNADIIIIYYLPQVSQNKIIYDLDHHKIQSI